jgi:hypothetical protein
VSTRDSAWKFFPFHLLKVPFPYCVFGARTPHFCLFFPFSRRFQRFFGLLTVPYSISCILGRPECHETSYGITSWVLQTSLGCSRMRRKNPPIFALSVVCPITSLSCRGGTTHASPRPMRGVRGGLAPCKSSGGIVSRYKGPLGVIGGRLCPFLTLFVAILSEVGNASVWPLLPRTGATRAIDWRTFCPVSSCRSQVIQIYVLMFRNRWGFGTH